MKENIKVMKHMSGSPFRSIELLKNLIGHMLPHLYSQKSMGFHSDTMDNNNVQYKCLLITAKKFTNILVCRKP